MMDDKIDLNGAIEKYLTNEWTNSEKDELKDIRHQFAKKIVPNTFSYFPNLAKLETIDKYINTLTDNPHSQEGTDIIESLGNLREKARNNLKDKTPFIGNIIELSEFQYLNNNFLGNTADISNHFDSMDNMTYHGPKSKLEVEFEDSKVTFDIQLGWDTISKLIPGKAEVTVKYNPPSIFPTKDGGHGVYELEPGVPTDNGTQVKLNDSSEDIVKAAIQHARQITLDKFDYLAKKFDDLFTADYTIKFNEGVATNDSVVLNQYSSKIKPLLDTLVSKVK